MNCPKHNVPLQPGKAIEQTCVPTGEWSEVNTCWMRFGGPGRLINCLKCPVCGLSVTK